MKEVPLNFEANAVPAAPSCCPRNESDPIHETLSARTPRKWTINGDFLTLRPTGVARYAREVTLALDHLAAQAHPLTRGLDIEIVAPRVSDEPLALRALSMRIVPEFRRLRLPQFWVQVQLPRHVADGLLSFCNLAPIAVRRQIVCIHDLQTRLVPESYSPAFRLAHRVILPLLGRRVAAVTTVSSFSRDTLVEARVATAEKITVTYNGSDHSLRWNASRSRLSRPDRRYVLCLWRNQPHKSPRLLIRLAPLLDALGLDLWMAGEVSAQALRKYGKEEPPNVRLLGRIGDEDLKSALLGAECFLFPSRIEGFGLPAIEAMACGCPVVCAPASSVVEVCGTAALYADPDDPQAWADKVALLTNGTGLHAKQARAGRARAALYSWQRIAEQYLELMTKIDKSDAPRMPRVLRR